MPDNVLIRKAKSLKAIMIFGGDIIPTEDPGHLGGIGWRSMQGTEADANGACPSIERVWAAGVLYNINPTLTFVVSGGLTNDPRGGKGETTARVASAELQQLGVPASQIIEEPVSYTSAEQLVLCSKVAREQGWMPNDIGILTVYWHFPRIFSQMIEGAFAAELLPFVPGITTMLSAERVLMQDNEDRWGPYFKDLYSTPEMQARMAGECSGTGQLLCGHKPEYPKPYRGYGDPLGR